MKPGTHIKHDLTAAELSTLCGLGFAKMRDLKGRYHAHLVLHVDAHSSEFTRIELDLMYLGDDLPVDVPNVTRAPLVYPGDPSADVFAFEPSVPVIETCTMAPPGWYCNRRKHHQGPCDARPLHPYSDPSKESA